MSQLEHFKIMLIYNSVSMLTVFRLMEIAKEMIQESLPIKCLEAVILSLYLTSPMLSTQRIAVGFKSRFDGMYFRHVVLVVQHGGLYGALGLSRRKDLMYKPLVFRVCS